MNAVTEISRTTAKQPLACPLCNIVASHAANCTTQLDTPEKRIRHAARLFQCFYEQRAEAESKRDGLSTAEIETGARLAEVQRFNRARIHAYYGNPAYGSYTVSDADLAENEARERVVIDAHLATLAPPAEAAAVAEQLWLSEAFRIASGRLAIPPKREHLVAVIKHARAMVSAAMQTPEVA